MECSAEWDGEVSKYVAVSGVESMSYLFSERVAIGADSCFPCLLPIPDEISQSLTVLSLQYWSIDQGIRVGQLVVHRAIVERIRKGFNRLCAAHFPIATMVPIVAYGWDDVQSMAANNTSAFNFRCIAGTDRLSLHAYGLAVDINPLWNPCCGDGIWTPDAPYVPEAPGTIARDSWVVRLFEDLGFKWGGDWSEPFDPQHFQMSLASI